LPRHLRFAHAQSLKVVAFIACSLTYRYSLWGVHSVADFWAFDSMRTPDGLPVAGEVIHQAEQEKFGTINPFRIELQPLRNHRPLHQPIIT
jgi:hypothetical protein